MHAENDENYFVAGDIREGSLLHKRLTVFVRRLDRFADGDDLSGGLCCQTNRRREAA